ncbi:TPA: phage tail tip protein J-related protein [Photobacterium damselae]
MASAVVAIGLSAMSWGTAVAIDMAVISLAFTYKAAKKAQSAQAGASASERKQIIRSSSEALNFIYGKTRSAGVMFFAQEQEGDQSEDEWIHLAITHAGHPISDARNFKLNDEPIETFVDLYRLESYPKGRTTVDGYMQKNCKDWTDKMIGEGFAWYRLSLKFDQEKFPTGLPNINAEKWGWEIQDPRTGHVAWTDNPALCILHYLKTKLKWEDEYLILETFIEAAKICDEMVSNPDGTAEKRYSVNLEYSDADTPASVLDKLKSSCGGDWIRVGGRLGLRVGAYYGPAFYEITEHDIIGDIEIQSEPSRKDSFNVIRGTFVNPEQNYTEVDYPQVRVDEWVKEDGEEIPMDLDLTAVHSAWQAQRLADIALKRNRLGMIMKLPCNLRAFNCPPGTMIKLSLEQIGFVKTEFLVIDWEYSQESGCTLTVQRDLPDFYDDAIGEPIVTPPLIDLPVGGVPAPQNPTFSAQPLGDIVQGVVSWTNSAFRVASTNVILKSAGGTVLQTINVPYPGDSAPLNGKLAGEYKLELQAVGINGARSSTVTMSIIIDKPRVPDSIDITASNWSMWLRPIYKAGTTPFGTLFEFYGVSAADYGSNKYPTDNVEPDEISSAWSRGGLTPDTQYYYFIRAVNTYGKSGWTKVSAKTSKERGLVETLVEKLIGIEIYAGYMASHEGSNPAFFIDGVNKMGKGIGVIKGAKFISGEIVSDNYVPGKTGYRLWRDGYELNGGGTFNGDISHATGTLTSVKIVASQIEGDIVSAKSVHIPYREYTGAEYIEWHQVATASVKAENVKRNMTVSGFSLLLESVWSTVPGNTYTKDAGAEIRVKHNGSIIFQSEDISSSNPRNVSAGKVRTAFSLPMVSVPITPNQAHTLSIEVRAKPNASKVIRPAHNVIFQTFQDGHAFN